MMTKNVAYTIGRKFGMLTLIKELEKTRTPRGVSTRNFLAQCECGTIKKYRANSITRCLKSCGCLRTKFNEPGKVGFNQVYRIYKRNAKLRNLDFKLSKDDVKILTKENCYYCNSEPTNKSSTRNLAADQENQIRGLYIYNGIDRLDNNRGYEPYNVVSCCRKCNQAKMDMEFTEFLNHIQKIYNFRINP